MEELAYKLRNFIIKEKGDKQALKCSNVYIREHLGISQEELKAAIKYLIRESKIFIFDTPCIFVKVYVPDFSLITEKILMDSILNDKDPELTIESRGKVEYAFN